MNKTQLLTLIKGIIPDTVAKTLTTEQLKEIAIAQDMLVDQTEFKNLVFAPNAIDNVNKVLSGETDNYYVIAVSKNTKKFKISKSKTGEIYFKGNEFINTASRFGKLGHLGNDVEFKVMVRQWTEE